MQVPDVQLQQPKNLDEAIQVGSENNSFDWLGGGTDLLCNYKWGINVKERLISLRQVAELQGETGTLHAGRTLYDLEHDPVLQENFPAIPNAAALVASPLIRRSATLGGNLLLDTRCWHFNQTVEWRRAHGSCLKAEADVCRVLPLPGDVCVATFSGDLAPVLLVYGAQFHLFGNTGTRVVDAANFYAEDGIRRFTNKKAEEILVQASLPNDAIQWQVSYQKLRLRDTFDFPEGGVAVGLQFESGLVKAARIATTAYASIPMLHPGPAEILVGQPLQSDVIDQAANALMKEVRPMKNTSMSPAYRKKMARVLCRRALESCGN